MVAGSFEPKLVPLVAAAPNAIDTNGSQVPQDVASLMAPATKLVAPVSPRTIPGFVDPTPSTVGSGADVDADGDDPHWPARSPAA